MCPHDALYSGAGRHPAQAAPFRPELSAEHGVTLIETLIAAVILVAVVFGVLASLDAASHTTAVNRGRTVAASLAEQDIERLRGSPDDDARQLPQPRPPTTVVGGTEYKVDVEGGVVPRRVGHAGQLRLGRPAGGLHRLTSTVTSNVLGKRVKPVELTSIVAPRVGSFGANQGTLAVQVKNELDRSGAGMPVTIPGPSYIDTTNELGCAVFGHIPAGTYTVQLSQPGWVDRAGEPDGEPVHRRSPPGPSSTVSLEYAPGRRGDGRRFDTEVRGTKGAATSPALTAANTGLATGARVFKPSRRERQHHRDGPVPVPGRLHVLQRRVRRRSKPDSATSRTTSTTFPGFVKVGGGGTASVTVREPALNLRVTRGPNQPASRRSRRRTSSSRPRRRGCADRYVFDGVNAERHAARAGACRSARTSSAPTTAT